MEKDRFQSGTIKVIAFVGILVIMGLIHIVSPDFYHQIGILATKGDIKATSEFLRSYGPWAILVSFLLDVFINAVGVLPTIFLSTANGVIFGLPIGVTISWVAESVGVIISFLLMRYFLRSTAEKVIEKSKNLQRLDEMSSENGLAAMALARTLPYFPSGILTALGAVSKMSLRDYCIATFIGKFPSTALEVIMGHDIVNYKSNMHRLGIMVILIMVVYGTMFYRRRQKLKAEAEAEAETEKTGATGEAASESESEKAEKNSSEKAKQN